MSAHRIPLESWLALASYIELALAKAVHTGVCQEITAAQMHIDALRFDPKNLAAKLATASEHLQKSAFQLRGLLLSPIEVDAGSSFEVSLLKQLLLIFCLSHRTTPPEATLTKNSEKLWELSLSGRPTISPPKLLASLAESVGAEITNLEDRWAIKLL